MVAATDMSKPHLRLSAAHYPVPHLVRNPLANPQYHNIPYNAANATNPTTTPTSPIPILLLTPSPVNVLGLGLAADGVALAYTVGLATTGLVAVAKPVGKALVISVARLLLVLAIVVVLSMVALPQPGYPGTDPTLTEDDAAAALLLLELDATATEVHPAEEDEEETLPPHAGFSNTEN